MKYELCKSCEYNNSKTCSVWKYVKPVSLDCADYSKKKSLFKHIWVSLVNRLVFIGRKK